MPLRLARAIIAGRLPPSERLRYQTHIPCRSKGELPSVGPPSIPAPPPVSAATEGGYVALGAIRAKAARSTGDSRRDAVLLVLTSAGNTVSRMPLFWETSPPIRV